MSVFQQKYDEWLAKQINEENSPRRREILKKGLGHGTVYFLEHIWFPVVGNFDHLYPEWEVRDFNNGFRYIDVAYLPGHAKGGIEIQGYKSHARDLNVSRFKDLCWRHCLLALDGWVFLPLPYLSFEDEPEKCRQLVLSFIGKFISSEVPSELSWLEAETIRLARRLLRPFTPAELADHLRVSNKYARQILKRLVDANLIEVASGQSRIRTYKLTLMNRRIAI